MSLLTEKQELAMNQIIKILKSVFPDEYIKCEINLKPEIDTGKYKLVTETFHTGN